MTKFFTLAPSLLPSYSEIVQRLRNGVKSLDALAHHLGVSVATVRRWRREDNAPKAVLLALFWESDFGYSAISTHLRNEVVTLHGLTRSLRDEIDQLQVRIQYLEALGAHGAANSPIYGAQTRITRGAPISGIEPLSLVR